MDVSEQCGHTLEEQIELFNGIKPLFANKPLIVVLNKVDVIRPEELTEEKRELLSVFNQDGKLMWPCRHTCTASCMWSPFIIKVCQGCLSQWKLVCYNTLKSIAHLCQKWDLRICQESAKTSCFIYKVNLVSLSLSPFSSHALVSLIFKYMIWSYCSIIRNLLPKDSRKLINLNNLSHTPLFSFQRRKNARMAHSIKFWNSMSETESWFSKSVQCS